ncbi:MAG: glycosyltransferase [Sedimentisphaerales bacterium]|jgi:UDP-N-acetylglucosamine transferase subunit ALG13
MIFLTVGTQFPFDRLVRAVDSIIDKGLISETLFAQIGESSYKPRNFESAACLEKGVFDDYMRQASGIIGHAGMGTITMALCNHKPLLVMPRLRRYHEVVNDHQSAIAKKFSELGYVLAAYDTEDLPESIRQLKTFVPKEREANPDAVADRIRDFLNNLQK